MLVSICYETINNSVSIFHTQFVLDLFLFFKQFQSHCVCKAFFRTKSKPSSNLNHKEGKQEEATTNKSTTISGSWVKNKSRVIYPWNSFLGEREEGSFSRAIMKATNYPKDSFPRQQFPGGYCHGAIIFEVIVRN